MMEGLIHQKDITIINIYTSNDNKSNDKNFPTHSMRLVFYIKPDKYIIRKEIALQSNILNEYICKTPQQNVSKPNSRIYKKSYTP